MPEILASSRPYYLVSSTGCLCSNVQTRNFRERSSYCAPNSARMYCRTTVRSRPVLTAFCDLNLVVKMDVDAAIASAFLLDLADSHLTDFAR